MEQPPWPQDKHPWFQGEHTWPQGEPTWPQGEPLWLQCEPTRLRLGLHDSIISISISSRAAAIVAGGAFGALFDPLDHRGTCAICARQPWSHGGPPRSNIGPHWSHVGPLWRAPH
jgi:hypothetical protein